jgi:hypothetical protein
MPDLWKFSKKNFRLETLELVKIQINIHSSIMNCTYLYNYTFCWHSVYTAEHTEYHIYQVHEWNIRWYSMDHRDLQE